jgi:FixJ family two-component response regulator
MTKNQIKSVKIKKGTLPSVPTVTIYNCPSSRCRAHIASGNHVLVEPLTDREREILHLISQGLANKAFSRKPGVSSPIEAALLTSERLGSVPDAGERSSL